MVINLDTPVNGFLFYAIIYFLLYLPVLIIALTAYQIVKKRLSGEIFKYPAFGISFLFVIVSTIFLQASLVFQELLGPSWTQQRFITIYINLGLNFILAAVSLLSKAKLKYFLVATATAAFLAWGYVYTINSVVW
jgi:hypothetical protein